MNISSIPLSQRSSLWTHARTQVRRALLAGASAALLALGACGGGGDDVDRGPTTIPVAAKLNGLFWDAQQSRLYLTDDEPVANEIKTWDGGEKFSSAVKLPDMEAGQRTTLGQIARGPGGHIYATRFGFGSYGTVVVAPKSGAAHNLDALDPTRRRISLVATPDGALLGGWFRGGTAGVTSGHVSELTLHGGQASERELIVGLHKPVGLALVGDKLFVADQGPGTLLQYSLAAVRRQTTAAEEGKVLATFMPADGLDLMTAAADGTLYVASGSGRIYRVGADGKTAAIVSGWPGIRGLALDADNRRLFAAVSAADGASKSSIRIVPLD